VAIPDFADLHRQRQQHSHLTRQLLWEEYRRANPDGYRYSRFFELYQRRRRKQDVGLRQERKAGEKLFVDWAGTTIPIHDPRGGPVQQAHLFVAVVGQLLHLRRGDDRRAVSKLDWCSCARLRVLLRHSETRSSGTTLRPA
jgi:transposase